MTFTNTIKVDVGHPWKTAQVYVKQGDVNSRKIRAELMNGAASWTIPVGTVATFRAKKPDDTVVTQDATIGSPNIVEVVLDEQVGAVFGVVRGEIRLVNGGEILNTFLIAINVEAAAVTDGDIVSRDVLDEYQALVDQMLAVAGSPLVANAAADMTDKTRVYVYTGSEVGYVTGDWYYWDGAAWTAGGAYNSQGIGDAFIEQTADYIRQSTVATESDRTPYLFRPTPNPSAILADEEIVGGTVAYNQVANPTTTNSNGIDFVVGDDHSISISGTASGNGVINLVDNNKRPPVGHKVLCFASGVENSHFTVQTTGTNLAVSYIHEAVSNDYYRLRVASGTAIITPEKTFVAVIDLTAQLGATIANYLYTLDSGTAGAGIAKLREWGFLSKDYFAYDAGSLVSVNTEGKRVTGRNLFDKSEVTTGVFLKTDGTTGSSASYAITDYIPCVGNAAYIMSGVLSNVGSSSCRCYYDAGKNFISGIAHAANITTFTDTTPANAAYLRDSVKVADLDTTMIEKGTVAGTYRPYRVTTYPTTDTDLNGIFKLDANNNLYADGDVYKNDGTVTRRYALVDLGSLSYTKNSGYDQWYATAPARGVEGGICVGLTYDYNGAYNRTTDGSVSERGNSVWIYNTAFSGYTTTQVANALSGKYLCYCLETPTTETATPYTAMQIVGKGGTEEWIDSRAVPVPVGHETVYGIGVPDVPANASNATLKATVSGGKTTLSWS